VKDERVYLLHAIDAIDAITSYTADGHDAFLSDPMEKLAQRLADKEAESGCPARPGAGGGQAGARRPAR
jgi:hypothetical protein